MQPYSKLGQHPEPSGLEQANPFDSTDIRNRIIINGYG